MAFTNPTKVQQTPVPPQGSNPKGRPSNWKVAGDTAPIPKPRTIGPMTKFDPESGVVVPSENSWKTGAGESSAEGPAQKVAPKAEPYKNERHQAWKAEQEKKQAERQEAAHQKAVKRQATARDLLQKGDLVGAAKALGLSPQEFALYAQNAMLSIPTKEKELSPEEKKAREELQYKEALEAKVREFDEFRIKTNVDAFIKDKIAPVLADKDRFELINKNVDKATQAIYHFMDEHYKSTQTFNNETGKWEGGDVLDVVDIAESIEQELEKAAIEAIESSRKIKKLEKLFANKEPKRKVEVEEQPEQEPEREELADAQVESRPSVNVSRGSRRGEEKPFWLMTPAEKAAYVQRNSQ